MKEKVLVNFKYIFGVILVVVLFLSFQVGASKTKVQDVDYLYLSDLDWQSAKSSWNDKRALKKNENESGNLISLIINDEETYFLKGVFAHASSEVVYNLSDYNFDTFATYVGVDASRGASGNGVRFSILVSHDGKDWITRRTTDVLKGNMEAVYIEEDIKGYEYLKLVANHNGDQSSDHSVYAGAILYKRDVYKPNTNTKVDFIKTVDEYDQELRNKTEEQIINDEALELKLLQRTLVKKVTYSLMQAYATGDSENAEFLKWLFADHDLLKAYLLGGDPEGSYIKAFEVFKNLRKAHPDDLDNPVFLKMMMAISLTYSTDVNFWQTANKPVEPERTPSEALDRYDVIKKLYLGSYEEVDGVSTAFDKDLFAKLEIEEMRWVVNNRISDVEIPWLNWFTQKTLNKKTKYTGNYMDPYTYIAYNSGWYYEDEGYYNKIHEYCAPNALNKLNGSYTRGSDCVEMYGLDDWHIPYGPNTPLRLWIVWEEDGVCGSLAGTGSNIEMAYGKPATLVSQPGHAAYFRSSRQEKEDGTHQTIWSIGNNASGWGDAYKSERMLLGWGNQKDDWVSTYNGSYLVVSSRAVDNFATYEKAYIYNLVGDMKNSVEEKSKTYNKVLEFQPYNITAWYGLINAYLADDTKTSSDYLELAKRVIENLKEFPMPMHDLLELFESHIENNHQVVYSNLLRTTLEAMATDEATKGFSHAKATTEVAKYLLGIEDNLAAAKFSFDGDDANKIILQEDFMNRPFEYSLNYDYDVNSESVSSSTTWETVSNSNEVDLSEKLGSINVDHDIVIHFLDDENRNIENVYVIDITKAEAPKGLFANDLENVIIGVNDKMEWQIASSAEELKVKNWTKYSVEKPDLDGMKKVFVRIGANGTTMASDAEAFTFEIDPNQDATKKYISFSRLEATASSSQNANEAPSKAIDGNPNTMWHTNWDSSDHDLWFQVKLDRRTEISKIDYMPRQDNAVNGRITKAKIEVSLDGKNWTLISDEVVWNNDATTKSYFFPKPTLARFVRITALETKGNGIFASAAMFNFYENTVTEEKSLANMTINYMESGYIYNGEYIMPNIVVFDGNEELIINEDFQVEYLNNLNAGAGTIKITGLGIYAGVIEKTFTISKAKAPALIPDRTMSVASETQTLEEVSLPEGWVWENKDQILQEGINKAKAIAIDKNNYLFNEMEITIIKAIGQVPKIKADKVKFDFDMKTEEEKDLSYFTSLVTITDAEDGPITLTDAMITTDYAWGNIGTYFITYTVTDKDNNTVSLTMEITLRNSDREAINIEGFTIEYLDKNLIYNGQYQEPTLVIKDNNDHILKLNKDYVLAYQDNLNAGLAQVKITGQDLYAGEITSNFAIAKQKMPDVLPNAEIMVSENTDSVSLIALPEGWTWLNEGIILQPGKNVIQAIYLGDINHESYTMNITVMREAIKNTEPEEEKGEEPEKPEENTNNSSSAKETITNNNDNNQTTNEVIESKPKANASAKKKTGSTTEKTAEESPKETEKVEELEDTQEETKEEVEKVPEEDNQVETTQPNFFSPLKIIALVVVLSSFVVFLIFKKKRALK